MTREENLHWLDVEIRTWESECQSKHPIKEALYAARKALEQEPTTKNDLGVDCVSREKVRYMITGGKYSDEDYEQFIDRLVNKLEELPSVTPQEPRWIPVTERLPEDRRSVLVTAYWHETYQVMMASYYGDGLWWCVPFNNCGEHMQSLKPKAWMPLPEPYKGGQEG